MSGRILLEHDGGSGAGESSEEATSLPAPLDGRTVETEMALASLTGTTKYMYFCTLFDTIGVRAAVLSLLLPGECSCPRRGLKACPLSGRVPVSLPPPLNVAPPRLSPDSPPISLTHACPAPWM